MPSAVELAQGDPALLAAIRRSRRLLGRKALMAAAASAVPLPGIDFAADAALLGRLVPQISAEFGLAAPQIAHLSPKQRERVVQVAGSMGAVLVGKLVTRDLLITLARHAGMKLGAKQAARFVPLAGQVVSAALGYAALRAMGEQHIKDCVRVARAAQLVLPGPAASPAITPDAAETAALPSNAPRPFWRRLGAR